MTKPKVGFYWCASCGGCEEAVVDLAEDVLTVVGLVDIVFWPVAMDFKKSDLAAMADGELAACFVNGAVRSSEQREMVELCRRKSQLLVAFGSCSHMGGIPGLANLYDAESILGAVYNETGASTINAEGVRPKHEIKQPEGTLELPVLDESVKTLDQVVDVDYYLPGCAPPTNLIVDAVMAIVQGKLPAKGAVLAPDVALCKECPRSDSKPDKPLVKEFKRPHQININPTQCLLSQGLLCLGPATRGGCGSACIKGNMPCTGCLGPISRIRDYGAAALSSTASLLDSNDEKDIAALPAMIPDPPGTFYRYSLPASMIFQRAGGNAGATV